MLVMLIGGLWHGSSWTFVLWGAWHGSLLVVDRLRRNARPLPRPLGIALTSVAVAAGWVIFRAPSLSAAAGMYGGMIGLHGAGLSPDLGWQLSRLSTFVLGTALLLTWVGPWVVKKIAAGGKLSRWTSERAWVALLPLFFLGLLKIMAESYTPVLYAKF
jgi:alginate O-acetyltransferase complex protein AlgI